jgi:gamma-glutamylcyclotransferase (GGCT)/AIG2-like uncharacterized protein YtfP
MDRLLAYGTLMPGRLRWPLVQAMVASHHPASIGGTLFDTGRGYPAATCGAGPGIHGAVLVFHADQVDAAFALLDEVEGAAYRRITVTTDAGEQVATYEWIAPLDGLVPISSGRWDASNER